MSVRTSETAVTSRLSFGPSLLTCGHVLLVSSRDWLAAVKGQKASVGPPIVTSPLPGGFSFKNVA
jgi:hypothetical protein